MKIFKIMLLIILAVALGFILVTGGQAITMTRDLILLGTPSADVVLLDTEYDAADVERIEIILSSEDAYISGSGGDNISVHHQAPKNTEAVNVALEDGVLRITEQKQLSLSALFSVRSIVGINIPRGYEGDLVIRTSSGNVSVTGAELPSGSISVDASSGNAEFIDILTDTMNINTASGEVVADAVDVKSFEALTVSGNVSADFIASEKVSVNTTSGNSGLTFGSMPAAVKVDSVSGNAGIFVPQGEKVDVEFDSASGNMENHDTMLSETAVTKINVRTVSGDFVLGSFD